MAASTENAVVVACCEVVAVVEALTGPNPRMGDRGSLAEAPDRNRLKRRAGLL
jgi:hypothetical protein